MIQALSSLMTQESDILVKRVMNARQYVSSGVNQLIVHKVGETRPVVECVAPLSAHADLYGAILTLLST